MCNRSRFAITEKLLSGAGGWQAMKAARELLKAGCVSAATYEPPLLAGQVREGQKTYRAGLRIRSASDIENICTCRESREWGKICAHSLAVGLAYLAPVAAPQSIPPNDARASRRFAPRLTGRAWGNTGCTPFHPASELPCRLGERRSHGLRGSGVRRTSRDARRAPACAAVGLRRRATSRSLNIFQIR